MENWTLQFKLTHLLKIEIIEVSKLFEADEDFLEAQIEQFQNNPLVTLHGLHFEHESCAKKPNIIALPGEYQTFIKKCAIQVQFSKTNCAYLIR